MKLKKFKKAEANIALIMMAFGAILLVAFFIYSKSMTGSQGVSMNAASQGLDAMVDKLNE